MKTLVDLVAGLGILINVGCLARIIILLIQMAFDTEDKSPYKVEIKNVLIVLIISLLATAGAIAGTVYKYF